MTKPQSYWNNIESEYGHLGDRVRCKICNKCFKFLGGHIRKHRLLEMEYKDKFKLLHNLPLCIPELEENCRVRGYIKAQNIPNDQLTRFVNSNRNKGKRTPAQTNEHRSKTTKGIARWDAEGKKKLSEIAKNRPLWLREHLSNKLKRYSNELECIECGIKYKVSPPSLARNGKRKFCTNKCRFEWLRKNKSEWVNHTKHNSNWLKGDLKCNYIITDL